MKPERIMTVDGQQRSRAIRLGALMPTPIDPVLLAGRQGFDDGYFRSDEEQRDFENEAERVAYDREFARGRKQRQAADRFSKAKR